MNEGQVIPVIIPRILLSARYDAIVFVWDRTYRAFQWLCSKHDNASLKSITHRASTSEYALLEYKKHSVATLKRRRTAGPTTWSVLVYNMAASASVLGAYPFFSRVVAERTALFGALATPLVSLYATLDPMDIGAPESVRCTPATIADGLAPLGVNVPAMMDALAPAPQDALVLNDDFNLDFDFYKQ